MNQTDPPRKIDEIINQIIKHIPSEEESMMEDIKELMRSIQYASPEYLNAPHFWIRLSDVLEKHLGHPYPTQGWKKEIADIFCNKNQNEQTPQPTTTQPSYQPSHTHPKLKPQLRFPHFW